MSNTNHNVPNTQGGLTLLITLLLMSVLLGVSASLLNVTLKQFLLSGIVRSSEMAFQAASAGMECVLYYDYKNFPSDSVFDVPGNGNQQGAAASIDCMDAGSIANVNGQARSSDEQLFAFTWGTGGNQLCTEISVYKYHSDSGSVPVNPEGQTVRPNCPQGSVCTVVKSRGYNVACNDRSNPRAVERELTQVY